ncbi:hypothetical protein DXA14_26190 [Hungatella hathewayi]|nr:hypothetical protein DXA14_26190 [Hungatella hathewayi]
MKIPGDGSPIIQTDTDKFNPGKKNFFPGFCWCARRRTFLTGASPESARWWEGYSRRQGCPS